MLKPFQLHISWHLAHTQEYPVSAFEKEQLNENKEQDQKFTRTEIMLNMTATQSYHP